LATLSEWKELWLNEGFAEFMQYLATDSIFPELSVLEYFFSMEHEEALEIDSSKHSHPVQPSKFQGFLFDGITYNKGASCLWMMYWYVQSNSNTTLYDGLKTYLDEHPFGIVTTDELFNSLVQSTRLPLDATFKPWVRDPGYPVIKVSHDVRVDKVVFHFKMKPCKLWKDETKNTWPVFLNMTLIMEQNGEILFESVQLSLHNKVETMEFDIPSADVQFRAFLLNPQRVGFYRTQYSSELLTPLVAELGHFGVSDRMGLISDTIALLMAGYYPLNSGWFLHLKNTLSFIEREDNADVWSFFLDQSLKLEVATRKTDYYDSLIEWICDLLERTILELTWQSKAHALQPIKSRIFHSAVRFHHKQTVEAALEYFDHHQDYDPSLQPVVLEAAVRYGNHFDQVLKMVEDTHDYTKLDALGATMNSTQQQLLIARFNESPYFVKILESLLEYGNYEVVWHAIKETMVGNLSKYEALLEATVSQFNSRHLLREAKKHKNKAIQRGLERAKALQHFRESVK
jgi:hypothetical protein